MSTEPTMATWVIVYNDYSGSVAGVTSTSTKVDAAYFGHSGNLIEFKGLDHQVVFAIHAGIVSTISRDSAAVQWEQNA
jgi:hypothetical protein